MDCVFVLEGENKPIVLEHYLKQKFEGRDVIFAVRLSGKTQHYLAKWLCHSKHHRLALAPFPTEAAPVVHFVPTETHRTTLYKVSP